MGTDANGAKASAVPAGISHVLSGLPLMREIWRSDKKRSAGRPAPTPSGANPDIRLQQITTGDELLLSFFHDLREAAERRLLAFIQKMSKPFAKKFYKSAAWVGTREAYVSERTRIDGGLCERCGKTSGNPGEELHHIIPLTPQNINDYDICLNPANLQWLCKDCHFIVHRELIMEQFAKARRAKQKIVHNGCYFNDEGELVQMAVYIVHGSPASGKSTLVRERMTPGDLVVDLDNLKQAISLQPKTETPDNLLSVAMGLRDYLYQLIEERAVDCCNVWVIASLPRKKERQELAERLNAELIHCPADYHECILRAGNDNNRRDKVIQRALIDKYFEQYEP